VHINKGIDMFRLRCLSLAVFFSFSFLVNAAEKPEVFLCVQKDSALTTGQKTVYGYIHGVKTECMPEGEFFEVYAKQMAAFEKALGNGSISNTDAIRLLQKGEKNLSSAKFQGFDFMGISFKRVNLTKADFEGADLRNTSFHNANCSRTSFAKAFIKNSSFRNADVTNADFTGAYISETDFVDAKGLKPDMFKSAVTLYNTTFDSVFAQRMIKRYPDLFKKPKKCWETNTWMGDSTDCDESKNIYEYKEKK
jgi:hypothetical protein